METSKYSNFNSTSFELLVIDISGLKPKSLYAREFKTHPRIGEWLDIEIEGESTIFEVVKIAHSTNGGDSDLYVKFLGLTYEVVKSLCCKND